VIGSTVKAELFRNSNPLSTYGRVGGSRYLSPRTGPVSTGELPYGFLAAATFYVLLPPLAWAGAALVEVAITRILGV